MTKVVRLTESDIEKVVRGVIKQNNTSNSEPINNFAFSELISYLSNKFTSFLKLIDKAKEDTAELIKKNSTKFYRIEENKHPYAAKSDADTKVVRTGNEVHIQMTMIRSHFSPDNIEGIKVGDKVYFHVTNLEQDYDVPHGIAMIGANTSELLIMPGQTETFVWEPKQVGVWPFYCTDFCSALHQEMQGYVRVSPADSNIPLKWSLGEDIEYRINQYIKCICKSTKNFIDWLNDDYRKKLRAYLLENFDTVFEEINGYPPED